MTKISEEEAYAFDSMFNKENNLALMRAHLDDEEIAVIVRFRETDTGAEATPLAIIVTDNIFSRIIPPSNPYEGMEKHDDHTN
jgi:hypothetical protein